MRRVREFCWLAVALMAGGAGCGRTPEASARQADSGRARETIVQFGCGACHTIPGVRGARALVGPKLDAMASRSFVGGVLPNTLENVARWIEDPLAVNPKTAMPKLGLSRDEALNLASYLYTQQ